MKSPFKISQNGVQILKKKKNLLDCHKKGITNNNPFGGIRTTMPTDVLYIKCCILTSQIPDTTNDILQRRDIKKIFTNTKNLNFDIEHQRKYLSGIEIVENYINQSEEHIKGTSIPPGSWIMVLAIYNNTLQQAIQTGEIRGVSLRTALGEDVNLTDKTLHNNRIQRYNQRRMQSESVNFTNAPANEILLEVMTYEACMVCCYFWKGIFGEFFV